MEKTLENKILKYNSSLYSKKDLEKISKKGLYDVWFTIIDDLEHHEAYWIRYAVMVPKLKSKTKLEINENEDLDKIIDKTNGVSILWFSYTNTEDPNRNYMIKKIYPLSRAEGTDISGDGVCIFKIDEAEITLGSMKGDFETESGKKFAWDLTFSHFMEPYNPIPSIAKFLKLTSNFWYPSYPNMRVSGTITCNGETKSLSNIPATQSHTFGYSYSQEFTWAHAHTFKDSPDAYFDLGAREGKTSLAFYDGNTEYFFNTISTLGVIKAERGINKVLLKGETKKLKIWGEISAPKETLIGVEYLGPQGNKLYCYNTETADLKFKVSLKNPDGSIKEEKEFNIEKSVCFESNWLKPQENLKYLPWDKEEL